MCNFIEVSFRNSLSTGLKLVIWSMCVCLKGKTLKWFGTTNSLCLSQLDLECRKPRSWQTICNAFMMDLERKSCEQQNKRQKERKEREGRGIQRMNTFMNSCYFFVHALPKPAFGKLCALSHTSRIQLHTDTRHCKEKRTAHSEVYWTEQYESWVVCCKA